MIVFELNDERECRCAVVSTGILMIFRPPHGLCRHQMADDRANDSI